MLVTKDIPLRVKAGAVGLPADEYHAQDVVVTGYTGLAEVGAASEDIDALFRNGFVQLRDDAATADGVPARELPVHCGVQLTAGTQSALGRILPGGGVRLVRGDLEASVCGAVRRSSASRWICFSTTRWASSRWAGAPAPGSPRWRCAPAWRR